MKFFPTWREMSPPTRSARRKGPMGIPKPAMARSIRYGSIPASTSSEAAIVYGKNTRFTAKPVQLPTTTGVLWIWPDKPSVSATICKRERKRKRSRRGRKGWALAQTIRVGRLGWLWVVMGGHGWYWVRVLGGREGGLGGNTLKTLSFEPDRPARACSWSG